MHSISAPPSRSPAADLRLQILSTEHERGRVPLRYLGSKSRLAEQIAVQSGRWGPPTVVFDLFAGVGHVSAAFADGARVIAADTSAAAASVLRWRLAVGDHWRLDQAGLARIAKSYAVHYAQLRREYEDVLAVEQRWMDSGDDRLVADLESAYGADPGISRMRSPESVITAYFGSAFFGASQAIQLDALRNAIDDARLGSVVPPDQVSTALTGLLCAATHLTNAPGHFAQHFKLTGSQGIRARGVMARDALVQWKRELELMRPAGSPEWRAKNVVLNRDSMEPWALTAPRGIAFADPPYTSSQYSRFYHVLDTIVRYDAPACDHLGRYRNDRYTSAFCRKREVGGAFERLMVRGLELAPSLYVTYPDNGLLQQSGTSIAEVANKVGVTAIKVLTQPLMHAAPGSADGQRHVLEEVWRIRA
jgi:adenine-specific DNA-methyltransferase